MISFEHQCRVCRDVGSKYLVIDFMVPNKFSELLKMRKISSGIDFPQMFLKTLHTLHTLHRDYIKNERILFLYIV